MTEKSKDLCSNGDCVFYHFTEHKCKIDYDEYVSHFRSKKYNHNKQNCQAEMIH